MPSDRDDPEPRQMIYEIRRRVQAARNRYWAEGVDGEVSDETHRELATAVLQYHDVLYEFRNESVLSSDDWPDIAEIRERVGRKARQRTQQGGLSRPATVTLVPAVTQVPIEDVLQLSEDLDDLAKTLGFAAAVEATRPLYDAGKRENYPDPVHPDIPKPKTGGGGKGPHDLLHSKLYHDWYQRVACGDPNDYVIAISADPRSTGVSGSGKTTFGGGLAKRWFDYSPDGFDAEVQYTLDAAKLAYDLYEDTNEMAVLVGDEMQGTPATTGLNAKRSQKTESLDAINAIAAGRSDRKTVILIVQDLKSLNKDALTFIDAWLLIRDDYDYIATHYGVAPDVFDLGSRETKTPGIEQITWDALPKDDEDYQVMEEKKAAAKRGEREYSDDSDDDSGESGVRLSKRDAFILRKAGELSQREIAKEVNDRFSDVEIGRRRVGQIISNHDDEIA